MFGRLLSCSSVGLLGFWEVFRAWLAWSSRVGGGGELGELEGWIWGWGSEDVWGTDSLGSKVRFGLMGGGGVDSLKFSLWGGEKVNSRFWGSNDSSLNSTFNSVRVMHGGEGGRLWRTGMDIGSIWISGEGEWEKDSSRRGKVGGE